MNDVENSLKRSMIKMRKNNEEKNVSCSFCTKKFNTITDLKNHMKSSHSNLISGRIGTKYYTKG